MSPQPSEEVQAHYESPAGTKDFNLPLSTKSSSAPNVREKTAYLSELRASTKRLQENINAFLTEKMAEDKAREAKGDAQGSKTRAPVKDDIEEEHYGEEALEDE